MFLWIYLVCMFFVLLVYDVFFDGVMHKIYHGSQILVTTEEFELQNSYTT